MTTLYCAICDDQFEPDDHTRIEAEHADRLAEEIEETIA
jgi:hypothetical protein